MRRAFETAIFISIFGLAFLPGKVLGFTSPCMASLKPPFIATGVNPNVLIILDNSQSMDEDFYGSAVGSWSSASKSVVARKALQDLVQQLRQQGANVGVMTFKLPGNVNNPYFLYNLMPFTSYDSSSYCPDPPAACQTYCITGDSTAKDACQQGCSAENSAFSTDFTDLLLDPVNGPYPFTTDLTGARARYCGLAYPKIWEWQDPSNSSGPVVYHSHSDALYIGPNGSNGPGWETSAEYGYCSSYDTSESPPNTSNYYRFYAQKTVQDDSNTGYSGLMRGSTFSPTDSDWAVGFYNFGQRMPFYYVGPTLFSNSSVSSPQGFLHVAVGDLSGSAQFAVGVSNTDQYDNVYDIFTPEEDDSVDSAGNPLPPQYPSYVTPYMSCNPSGGNYNLCSYIVNAGNTPTAGVLQTALDYFQGTYENNGSTISSPITEPCQKNYIILVTDGLPDTLLNGNQDQTQSEVMPQVLAGLEELDGVSAPVAISGTTPSLPSGYPWTNVTKKIQGKTYTFPVETYVLGLGLTAQAKANLDQMAAAGGTLHNGHAYYADQASEVSTALQSIAASLFAGVSSGSSVSVLASQTQSGANVLQGVFYSQKYFGSTPIAWPGYLYDWWFYNGWSYQNIREDTLHDYILELESDYALDFNFDIQNGLTVKRYKDPTGNGDASQYIDTLSLDSLTPIWEAGKLLWETPPGQNGRTIYTPGSSASGLVEFDDTNSTLTAPASSPLGSPSDMDACLQGSTGTATLQNLIDYVRGEDLSNTFCSDGTSFQSLCSDGNGNFSTQTCTENSDCTTPPYSVCSYVPCSSGSSCSSSTFNQCLPDSCRNRTVGFCAASDTGPFSNTPCSSSADCTQSGYTDCVSHTWKLGDIVYSTPKVEADYSYCGTVGTDGTNTYTSTACTQNADCTGGDTCLEKESVVFVGANDGMLHAFRTGVLSSQGLDSSQSQVTKLAGIPTSEMGTELWAFIPRNVLPYLRYLAIPPPNSTHLYYNDLTPYITTMKVDYCGTATSTGATYTSTTCSQDKDCGAGETCLGEQRTVLIGGLRMGGGSRTGAQDGFCFSSAGVSNGETCGSVSNCQTPPYTANCLSAFPTNVPGDTCSGGYAACSDTTSGYTTCYNPTGCTGLSSYYALDITDVEHPKLLWEFSDPRLGYSYSGPAVIHKWSNSTTMTGDQYDVMFLSGPTDPQDGSSSQNLRAFILTLDPVTLGIDKVYQTNFKNNTGNSIANAFGGRLFTTGLDVDNDGYTDYVFFGYSSSSNDKGNWGGGIGLIYTDATTTNGTGSSVIDPVAGMDPSKWTYDVRTYDNIPQVPITAQVATESCFGHTYLYTGTGRYFFPMDDYGSNGNSGLNFLMGVPFTCNDLYQDCGKPSLNSVNRNSDACSALQSYQSGKDTDLTQAGWLLDLSPGSGSYLSERMITDPTTSPPAADGSNEIYFTTTEPTNDPCGYGGQTFMYGLNCATAGAISDNSCPNYVDSNDAGVIYLQTSTGAINSINPSTSFTQNGGRETPGMAGIAPESSPGFNPPGPTNNNGQLIQWIEK